MSKNRFFFATKPDLIKIIQTVEQSDKFKYIDGLYSDTREFKILNSLYDYEYLGIDLLGNRMSQQIMIINHLDEPNPREIKLVAGGVRYAIDQLTNEGSIIFRPGGIYKNEYLIVGQISTMNNGAESIRIFKIFEKALRKMSCKKVGRYYLGEDAMQLYGKMRFITMGITQPEIYDLNIELIN